MGERGKEGGKLKAE